MEKNSPNDPIKKAKDYIQQIIKPADFSKAIIQFLSNNWQDFVGYTFAGHSKPIRLERRKQWLLYIAVDHSMWSQEIIFQKEKIIAKLNDQLLVTGMEIGDVRFQVQHNASSNLEAKQKEQKQELEIGSNKGDIKLDEKVMNLLQTIQDPKLRESFQNIAIALENKKLEGKKKKPK